MSSSSLGSDLFALVALLVISASVTLLLRYYLPIRATPAYLLLPVFLALVLPCSIILLVPIDLASTESEADRHQHAIWLPERLILACWKISYWLTFVLTWLLLPLLGEYVDSGFRDPRDRFVYSLRSNARYQLIALGIGLVGLIYFIAENGLHGSSIKSLVMALAYAWGLSLAIYLMGHGLVAIPRRLLHSANLGRTLRSLQCRAPKIHDKLNEAIEELADLRAQLLLLDRQKAGLSLDMRDWVDELADGLSGLTQARPSRYTSSSSLASAIPAVITPRYLADLARKLKRARHKHARFTGEWQHLVAHATYLQEVIDASPSKRLVLSSTGPDTKTLFTMSILTPSARFHLHSHVIPILRFGLGVLLGFMSIALVWSEIVHTITARISLINLTVVRSPTSTHGQIDIGGQIIASIWLLYMCTSALFSLSEIKVWGNRALVKRQTYAESATWYSLQVAKLTVPLAYNFTTMLEPTVCRQTAFFAFFGKLINLTPLGSGFSQYFPIFILVPVCATLFGLYGRIRRIVGFAVLEEGTANDGQGSPTADWHEGAVLIQREQQSLVSPAPTRGPGGGASGGRPDVIASGVGRTRYSDDSEIHLTTSYHDNPDQYDQRQARYSSAQTNRDAAQRSPRQGLGVRTTGQMEDGDDDGPRYFFQDLGERVRNTIDTSDRPQWFRELGDSFKMPKWMQSDDGENGNGQVQGQGQRGGERGGPFDRLFGAGSGGRQAGGGGAVRL